MIRWINFACSVCSGIPDSPLSKGAIAGVLFMIGVVALVLAAILGTAIAWTRRAKEIRNEF